MNNYNKKILVTGCDNYKYSVGYSLFETNKKNNDIEQIGFVIYKYAFLSRFRFTRRLFRVEITGLYELPDGSILAIAKKGIFKRAATGGDFHKVFAIPRGSKPLNICKTPSGHLFFGEYFQNMSKEAVHVYGSMDNGETWKVVYTFEAGNINHVHGLFWDEYTNRMWVLTGDRDNECIIGYTDDEFRSFHEVLRGGQEYRSCQLFFYKDYIIYATDSQYIKNEIRKIDRKTLEIIKLVEIQGSAIKGGQSGNVSFLSTTVEPSEVNTEKRSHLWYTKDGLHWVDAISYEKDCWPAIFQYGTIEFPRYETPITDKLYYSGRALKGLDGKSSYIEI